MSQHDELRKRVEQHKPKNKKSKNDDKAIKKASERVILYLETRFEDKIKEEGYQLIYEKKISLAEMAKFITRKTDHPRTDFDKTYFDRQIMPDGGVIYLVKRNNEKLPLIISEVKRQGTNDERKKEGKNKQSTGNAIERLGKNLIGIRAMMQYEDIVPFVCFGWGCDFSEGSENKTVLAKISTLNQLYPLNKTFVFKKDAFSHLGKSTGFSPVSMYFREAEWTENEMYEIMKEIAETSFRYYTT